MSDVIELTEAETEKLESVQEPAEAAVRFLASFWDAERRLELALEELEDDVSDEFTNEEEEHIKSLAIRHGYPAGSCAGDALDLLHFLADRRPNLATLLRNTSNPGVDASGDE